ncbi:methionyl-tRNA formyltransferase [Egicoccus halophilus]|uniref:Methionyl-tRNA formyltransferase n=1 Tax=Egicoccus halophilus TaxID=1670830 RepID=A0A8J3EY99_9ACTN|nr:methionyl-tRNA formyltransferase [Egicoccus halophilus]GGI07453.1 methionyl-tRNA formyltransferase [Egicoccus halophilus]
MRVAFLGTPDVAVPALHALVAADDVEVVVVLTNPDRPRGRSRTPVPPPVKGAAIEAGLDVWQPARPAEVLDELRALQVDACAVVAYGALLPRRVLDAGGHGFVNLHFSLLPRWRGAAPVQHALRAGDTVTGITTFVLDEGMDTGPVLDRVEVPVDPEESAGELLERLADLGGPVLVDSIRRLVAGERPEPQPAEGATLAPKITPDDVRIDWREPAATVVDLVRSADPAPGAHTVFRGRRLKVLGARVVDADGTPGTVVTRDADGVVVAAGEGGVRLRRVQPEGKPAMDGQAFANGYRPDPGESFGASAGAAS